MTTGGLPVEVMLAPGAEADITAFRRLPLDLPPEARVFADAGYLDQHAEGLLAEAGPCLIAQRRGNSRVPLPPWVRYIVQHERKRIETVFLTVLDYTISSGPGHQQEVKKPYETYQDKALFNRRWLD